MNYAKIYTTILDKYIHLNVDDGMGVMSFRVDDIIYGKERCTIFSNGKTIHMDGYTVTINDVVYTSEVPLNTILFNLLEIKNNGVDVSINYVELNDNTIHIDPNLNHISASFSVDDKTLVINSSFTHINNVITTDMYTIYIFKSKVVLKDTAADRVLATLIVDATSLFYYLMIDGYNTSDYKQHVLVHDNHKVVDTKTSIISDDGFTYLDMTNTVRMLKVRPEASIKRINDEPIKDAEYGHPRYEGKLIKILDKYPMTYKLRDDHILVQTLDGDYTMYGTVDGDTVYLVDGTVLELDGLTVNCIPYENEVVDTDKFTPGIGMELDEFQ